MFIAHLPAGYLLTRMLQRKMHTTKYLLVGLIASVFPDLDLLYFYFIDHRQTLHHEYWTHLPFVWLSLWLVLILITLVWKKKEWFMLTMIIFSNIILHLILDTFVGGIAWLYPLSHTPLFLVTIPARYSFWVENFIFSWTFLVEILITIAAVIYRVFERTKTKKQNAS